MDERQNKISIHNLRMDINIGNQIYEEEILQGEIEGVTIFHKAYKGEGNYQLTFKQDQATILLIIKGTGLLYEDNRELRLEEASIAIPPKDINQADIRLDEGQIMHFLEITKKYSAQDKENLKALKGTLSKWYYARFQDCKPYVEKIKSPNTISRTVLPGDIIPRVALGTVEAIGPDRVGEHSHPMLEQLFLGLSNNKISVFADKAMVEMNAFSILHIPLGSSHWVEVDDNCKMNYMWMDFFLTKDGEAWLDTHKHIDMIDPD